MLPRRRLIVLLSVLVIARKSYLCATPGLFRFPGDNAKAASSETLVTLIHKGSTLALDEPTKAASQSFFGDQQCQNPE